MSLKVSENLSALIFIILFLVYNENQASLANFHFITILRIYLNIF